MVALYQFNRRSPALLGCDCKYNPAGHPALRGVGMLHAIGDATGPGLPGGSVLSYTATWPDTAAQLKNPDAVQYQIQAVLARKWGIVIDSQWHSQSDYFNFSGKQSMTLQVHTMSDYAAPEDVKSIIDGEIYAATKSMPASQIRVVTVAGSPTAQLPAAPGAAPQPPPPDQTLTDFFSNNWGWIAAGAGALFLAREVL